MEVLARIKRLIVLRQYRFSEKSLDELEADGLAPEDALEAVLNANMIAKTLRSRNARQRMRREKLYVIKSFNFGGTLLYTKGKFSREGGKEIYYFFISAKASRHAN